MLFGARDGPRACRCWQLLYDPVVPPALGCFSCNCIFKNVSIVLSSVWWPLVTLGPSREVLLGDSLSSRCRDSVAGKPWFHIQHFVRLACQPAHYISVYVWRNQLLGSLSLLSPRDVTGSKSVQICEKLE